MDKTEVQLPAAKLAASVGTAAVAKAEELKTMVAALDLFAPTWSNIAAAMAAIYTFSMLMEWWWKKLWRPMFVRRGWIKEQPLVLTDEERRKVLRARRLAAMEAEEEVGK